MSRVTLIQAAPADPATGAAVPVNLAGGGSRPYTHLGLNDWRAGVTDIPRFTAEIGFDETGWTGGATPQTSALRFYPADRATVDWLSALYWNKASLTVLVGDDAAANPTFGVLLAGTVASIDTTDGVITLTIADLAVSLSNTVLVGRFAGTGGLEGGADAADRVKRRSWGEVFNVEGLLLDKVNNVYEFGDPSKPLQGIRTLRDKGRAGPIAFLGWQGSAAATLAALQVSVPVQGGGVVAPSIACAKWWTTPSGPLTADLYGEIGPTAYVNTVAEIAAAIVTSRSSLTIANVGFGAAVRNARAGVHVDSDAETVAQVLDRILLGVSLVWTLSPAGVIQLSEWTFGPPSKAMTWTHTGSAALAWGANTATPIAWVAPAETFETITTQAPARKLVYPPIGKRRIGYQKNQREQSAGEVSSAILASDTYYPDGTPASALQPAQAGADVTGDNTSKDTDAVGGVPAEQIKSRIVSLESILAPTGEVQAAFDAITIELGTVSSHTDTIQAQIDGTSDSYLKSQIAVGASATTAVATSVTDLTARVGTAEATLLVQSGTLADLTGRTLAYWQVQADAGPPGTDAFVTVQAQTAPGMPVTSNVAIGAQAFYVFNSVDGVWLKSFEVSGGNVRIYGNLELDGSVSTRNLQDSSVSQTRFFPVTSNVSCAYNTITTVVSATYTKHEDDSLLEILVFGQFNSGDDLQFDASIVIDGTAYPAGSFNVTLDSLHSLGRAAMTPFVLVGGLPAGDHSVSFQVFDKEPDDGPLTVASGSVMKVTEYKQAAV